ncbi:MAG: hypothetical protein R2684_01840 [Pyrinomonadaceae bacterium]
MKVVVLILGLFFVSNCAVNHVSKDNGNYQGSPKVENDSRNWSIIVLGHEANVILKTDSRILLIGKSRTSELVLPNKVSILPAYQVWDVGTSYDGVTFGRLSAPKIALGELCEPTMAIAGRNSVSVFSDCDHTRYLWRMYFEKQKTRVNVIAYAVPKNNTDIPRRAYGPRYIVGDENKLVVGLEDEGEREPLADWNEDMRLPRVKVPLVSEPASFDACVRNGEILLSDFSDGMLKSVDASKGRKLIPMPASIKEPSICVSDDETGDLYLAGETSSLFVTRNEGKSWKKLSDHKFEYLHSIRAKDGKVALSDNLGHAYLYDGEILREITDLPCPEANDVEFENDKLMVLCADRLAIAQLNQ